MSFALCQRINIKKNGELFVNLFENNGFKFLWKYFSATYKNEKRYLTYQLEISHISEKVQLDKTEVVVGNNASTILPNRLCFVQILEGDPKNVAIKISWRFKIAVSATKIVPTKFYIDSVSSFSNKSPKSCYMCHRLQVKNNGEMFVELKDGLGYTLAWTKEKTTTKLGRRSCRVYHFHIPQMNNGLQFDKLELKCQNSSKLYFFTWEGKEISPGEFVSVSMFDDEPRLVELTVFWSVTGDNLKSGEVEKTLVQTAKTQTSTVLSLIPPVEPRKSTEIFSDLSETLQKLIISSKLTFQKPKAPIPAITKNDEPKLAENTSSLLSFNSSSTLNDAFTTKKYSDVVFQTNDSKKIFAHRCILFSHSEIFEALFDQAGDIPVKIGADFSENVTQKAVDFCYGKIDAIQNFEEDLIKFADQYGIKNLKKACLKSLKDQQLTTENVCKIVEIAFEHNYTLLKQKCLQFIAQNKIELGFEKLSKLPVEIVISAFLSV